MTSLVDPARRAALDAFLAEYAAGRYFESHEVLEDAWLAAEGDEKTFLQALIQLTAAVHKGRRLRHARGMASLFQQALEKLEAIRVRHGAVVEGMDLTRLVKETAAARDRAAGGEVDGPVPTLARVTRDGHVPRRGS